MTNFEENSRLGERVADHFYARGDEMPRHESPFRRSKTQPARFISEGETEQGLPRR